MSMRKIKPNYLIWSNEHRAWWAPNECGYVKIISKAGRYSEVRATQICENANSYQNINEEPNEVMVLAPEHLKDVENG
jgi:hypothetical protein